MELNTPQQPTGTEIAIITMAGRFPGSRNLDEFWQNLCQGVDSIRFLSDEELESRGVDAALRRDPNFVKAAAVLDGMELFDATFFGYTPREAELIDPQHRIFLECAWEALERAGYDPEKYQGAIGVFAGATTNTYLLYHLVSNPGLLNTLDQVQIDVSNGADFLATRASYKLNLTGPSCTVQTACSTSLVAVHMACQSLLNQECDMALAGGVAIHVKHPEGYRYLEGGIVSPDGHCRAFDASASGTVFGSGVGVVVLKRLEDASAEGDHIHAIIRGSAVNNDGSLKVGYTAPSVEGQAAVITEALAVAGVRADTIHYVETHGTATAMGDPIEIRALTKAFRTQTHATHFCAIGSVKTNIGHLAGAAGVASLIKAALALEHHLIPPSLNFRSPNPEIDFAHSPFYVNTQLAEWKTEGAPRRAGVSSFGVGGTNAHAILEEAPPHKPSGPARPVQLLLVSAKTSAALEAAASHLAQHLKSHWDVNLADAAYTLQIGRQAFSYRKAAVCRSLEDAVSVLETNDPSRVFTAISEVQDRPVVFMFSGQGTQYVHMAHGLYETEPVFREQVDRCAELLRPHLGLDLREVIYPGTTNDQRPTTNDHRQGDRETKRQGESEAETQHSTLNTQNFSSILDQTQYTQPALFVIEYALAQLWQSWGVRPRAMIGHSSGEYVAACLAGVMSLEDALALVAVRGRLMQALPPGAMIAVSLSEAETHTLLQPELSIAAVNAPALTVVSGPIEAMEALQQRLAERGVTYQRLHTSHAFHSAMMEPILAPFAEYVRGVRLNPPQIPYLSNITGDWITTEQATDPAYWTQHLRQTVRFSEGIRTLMQTPFQVFLEVGPGDTLTRLARRHSQNPQSFSACPSTRQRHEQLSDLEFLLTTLGKLWLAGVTVDWGGYYAHERRQRVALPTYPFERQRYWIEPGVIIGADRAPSGPLSKAPNVADWFYMPVWKSSRLPQPIRRDGRERQQDKTTSHWLLFVDEQGLGAALAALLQEAGQHVIAVRAGAQFNRVDERNYTIDPRQRDEYSALLKAIGTLPDRIVHLWSLTANLDRPAGAALFDRCQDTGFYSLLFLAQALGTQNRTASTRIEIVSNSLQRVVESDQVLPEKATLLGACLVIPHEYAGVSCRCIDVVLAPAALSYSQLADQLLAEIQARPDATVLAYRGRQRWVQAFEPLALEVEPEPIRPLRPNGVYLITGGLTGVGFSLAKYLAQTVQAKLVLAHDVAQASGDKEQATRELEALGAQVHVVQVDVSDEAHMQTAIAAGQQRFGNIHGVIHATGATDAQALATIQETDKASGLRHFRSKVYGLFALEKALRGIELDFCLLNSSLSTVLGGLGYAAYAAADLVMDAFAQEQNQIGRAHWLSVDWDAWQLGGETEEIISVRADLAQLALTPAEGGEAFRRILAASTTDRVAVSAGDLTARIAQERQKVQAQSHSVLKPLALHDRPDLPNAYAAPRNELERKVAEIWQQLLGIEQLGIHDNFFELGGHSLLATQLRSQLYEAFKVEFSLNSLFEHATVAGVAKLIEGGVAQAEIHDEKPIAERIRTAFPTERQGLMEDYLKHKVARGLNLAVEQLPPTGNLAGFNLERVAVDLMWNLKQDFNVQFYPHEIIARPMIPTLSQYLLAEIDRMTDLPSLATTLPLSAYRLRPYRKRTPERAPVSRPASKNKRMVFLHSSPRAGSTLLRIMLAGHPALFCPPELNLLFFEDMQEWQQNIGFGHELEWTSAGVQWALMELLGLESGPGQAFVDDLVARNESTQHVYARLQALADTRLLVDKTPTYSMDLDTLKRADELFDKPQYIYLLRHPYPVMESLLRIRLDKLFGPSLFEEDDVDPYVVAEAVWAISNRNLLTFFDQVEPERCRWVRYEDLVTEPALIMSGLCRFLGVPFHEEVLQPYDGRRTRMIGGLGDPNILQHSRIESHLSEAWKKIKWPRRLAASTQQLAIRLGYELPENELPATAEEQALANLDQLSAEQVREMLQKLLADEGS